MAITARHMLQARLDPRSAAPTQQRMNYLAHLLLARHSDEAMVGAFLGDFVKGSAVSGFDPAIGIEILVHRRIDSVTDHHPVVVAARACFSQAHRRFSGIALDVFYDHVLARHWNRHSEESLAAFSQRAYRALARHAACLPAPARHVAERMAAQDWLGAYADFDGVDAALAGIGRRLSRGGDVLAACAQDLRTHYRGLADGLAPLLRDLDSTATRARH